MELIPILSTIILIATMSTFILAIGAYILYKIREGRAKQYQEKKPESLKAEYVSPVITRESKVYTGDVVEQQPKRMLKEERFKTVETAHEKIGSSYKDHLVKEERDKNSDRLKDYEVEMPQTRFKKFSNGSYPDLTGEEVKQGEIQWR